VTGGTRHRRTGRGGVHRMRSRTRRQRVARSADSLAAIRNRPPRDVCAVATGEPPMTIDRAACLRSRVEAVDRERRGRGCSHLVTAIAGERNVQRAVSCVCSVGAIRHVVLDVVGSVCARRPPLDAEYGSDCGPCDRADGERRARDWNHVANCLQHGRFERKIHWSTRQWSVSPTGRAETARRTRCRASTRES
jgi:hypothetical protein